MGTGSEMKQLVVVFALSLPFGVPALADFNGGTGGRGAGGSLPTTTRGAPGPVLGAGLPVLAVGFGVYWVVRRSKKKVQSFNR
jgi:hypothetical protein